MELFAELAKLFMATEGTPLRLGNVEFWIDESGPWAGQLTFSVPTSKWNSDAMAAEVASLARVYPEVGRIVARHSAVTA